MAQPISADISGAQPIGPDVFGRSYRSRSHAGFSPADIHGGSVSRVRVVPQTGGLILLAVAVLLGACTQRLTGIGFALVASPLLVLVLGPTDGVHVSNVLNLAVSLVVLSQTYRNIDLQRALTLAFPALVQRLYRTVFPFPDCAELSFGCFRFSSLLARHFSPKNI